MSNYPTIPVIQGVKRIFKYYKENKLLHIHFELCKKIT